MTWREHAPEPARLWIRWSPRRWPAPAAPCVDLAERRLLWPSTAAVRAEPATPAPPRADLVYLPPVPAGLAAGRAALTAALAAAGMPVLAQEIAGPGADAAGAQLRAIDLTAALLAPGDEGLEWLRATAPAAGIAWAVLPLLPGVTPAGTALEPWLDALAALAPAALLLPVPELAPADRRRLAETVGEAHYEEVFHGSPPAEREVARAAARRGLELFARRPPVPGATPRGARNRELAAALAEAGDLWLRLGRSEPEGEALLAAARHVDATSLDLAALAREGNLGIVDWLSGAGRRLIEETLAATPARGLEALHADWLGGAEGRRE